MKGSNGKHPHRKTQTLLQAEIHSERLISMVRLTVAVTFLAAALFAFLIGSIGIKALGIQAAAVMVVILYSGYFILNPDRHGIQTNFVFILVFLDIAVITFILWSFYLDGAGINLISSAVSGIYLIAIIFTAFHHKASLSIFCGLMSIIAYTILYYIYSQGNPFPHGQFNDYPIRILLLLVASVLGAVVSRNNSRTFQKVIASEIRYQNLVHRLPEMVFTLDENGNFIWSNMASHTVVGIPPQDIIGRNVRSLITNADMFRLDENGAKGTYGIIDADHNEKFVDLVVQAVDDEDRIDAEVFDGIMTDVTDREKAIAQREEMVQRLYQYQKMESLGMLASGMAHDFNNIMQTVNDLSAIILRETKEEETRRRLELINETMADAKFLVSELFALGRKKPLDYRHVNLTSLLEQIIPQFSRQVGSNYQLTLETPEQKLWVEGDPDHLKRIFQNLIGNSRDAMPEGGHIMISCQNIKRPDNEGVIQIRVSDTGTGIPPELTEKVFDPFFTTKKPGKGTGLGLALVRRIVMLHNGSIIIEKTGYEGTVFLIELPLSDEAELDSDTKAILLNRFSTTVLLLDDDQKIREVLKFFLKEFKYSVLEAADGNEAQQMLRANSSACRVVIMDWKLGNENPHQVIKSLRSITPDLIVLVVSGYPPDEKSIVSMQIARWFTKPYDRNLLDLEIQRALHNSSTQLPRKDTGVIPEETTASIPVTAVPPDESEPEPEEPETQA